MAANDVQHATIPLASDLSVKNTEASADIAVNTVVKLDASNLVSATQPYPGVVIATTDDVALGVTLEAIPNGKTGRIRPIGVVTCICSAAITAGAQVQASTVGKVKTLVAAKPQVGQALTTTTTDGDRLLVMLNGLGAKNA